MPELVARSPSDVPVAAPRRRPAKPKGGKRAARRRLVPAFMLAHPGRTAACAIVAAVLTGIVLNAAFFQTARHPAPLFAGAPTVAPKSPAAEIPVPAPRPVERLSSVTVVPPPASVAAPALVPPVPVPRAPVARVEPEPKRDLIGALLKSDAAPEPSERIAAAQKALMKVGYVLRPDGMMGATTRKAIEHFQRERSLTVTGDLDTRTLRELQAQSRVAIP